MTKLRKQNNAAEVCEVSRRDRQMTMRRVLSPALLPRSLALRCLPSQHHGNLSNRVHALSFGSRRSFSDLPPGTTITAKNPSDVVRGKMMDVQGGKMSEEEEIVEGHLHIAERAKNIVASNQHFQLATYLRVPDGPDSQDSVFSDNRAPLRGAIHELTGRIALFLDSSKKSDRTHSTNVKKISFSSISTGHIDPRPLMPIFTRVGLLPPVVRIVGDLDPAPENYTEELRKLLKLKDEDVGELYWMEPGGVFHVDLFEKRTDVKLRDFRSAKEDPLCKVRHEIIHIMNSEHLDWLPRFVANYKGHPLNEGFFYDVDRMGFSIFGWQKDTENLWAEYRFEFTEKVDDKESFFQNIEMLKSGIKSADVKY